MYFLIAENCKMWDVGSESGKFSFIDFAIGVCFQNQRDHIFIYRHGMHAFTVIHSNCVNLILPI